MKKSYPPTIAMRKQLVLVAILGLTLLMGLIIYNLWHSHPHPSTPITQNPALPSDTATTIDTAWYKAPQPTIPVAVNRANDLSSHPLPIRLLDTPASMAMATTVDTDQRAMQAPISSNQILAEIHHAETADEGNSTMTVQHTPQLDTRSEHSTQTEKQDFLTAAKQSSNDYLANTMQNPLSTHEIKAGAMIPAILLSGINSDLPGPITAQVRENVYDTVSGRYLLIPQGTKLQGIYDSTVAYGQQRVLIAWQRLLFPNGQSIDLSGMPGADVSGYAGFKDQTNNHYGRLFGSALLLSMISAGLQLSQPAQSSTNNNPSVNQTLAQNAGISLSQTTDQLLRKNMNIQPTLEVRPGYLFNVSVTQDIRFPRPNDR